MKFLVVGDEMVDRYWIGRVTRLNPEKKSIPLFSIQKVFDRPGGAGNVAANLEAMGAEVVLVSQRSGAIIKNRLIDEEDGIVARFDSDADCGPIEPNKLVEAADGCCAVVVSDYAKGAIDTDVISQIRALDLPTFADVKVRPDRWTEWCEAVFPNEHEYVAHKADYNWSRICVVKRSARGATVVVRGMERFRMPSKATVVKNVTGAGDTLFSAFVGAYMALGLHTPKSEDRITIPLELALDFAGKAVADPYTAAPTFIEVYGVEQLTGVAKFIAGELQK